MLPHQKNTFNHGMDSLKNEERFVLGLNDFFDPLRKRSKVHQVKYLIKGVFGMKKKLRREK